MTLEIISLTECGEGEIAVTFLAESGEERDFTTFVIARTRARQLELAVGETTTEVYDEVCRFDKLRRACKAAINLLAYGDNSHRKLVQKLRSKGFERDIAEGAANELEARGYLNDRATATREAERAARKLWGRRRIFASLLQKGYDAETAERALWSLEDAEVDFEENCAELLRQRYPTLPTEPRERSKLYAAMTRYGYSSSEITAAIQKIKKEL